MRTEITPHIAIDGHLTKTGKRRKTRIDRRTTRHPGYAASQGIRKRIEEGTLEIECAYHLGDEAILKAEQTTFSAAC